MPTMDSTAKAAIAADFAPAWFVYLDVVGDPVRVTTFGANVAFTGTGDADLDGNTFNAFAGQFLDVGDVLNSDTGSGQLSITLSGIVTIDTTLMNAIGDVSKWQGRTARVWFQVYDPTGVTKQGAIVPHYTGYMNSVSIQPGPRSQTILLTIENYLATFTPASNRTYANQKDYDSADVSAAASLAASNGSQRLGVGVNGSHGGPKEYLRLLGESLAHGG